MTAKLLDLYRSDPDPGIHGAASWLLRMWGQKDKVQEVDKKLAANRNSRIEDPKSPSWYVNSQGQTMVVIPGPVEFTMGSPPEEEGRNRDETQHQKRIGRTFAIAASPVTKEQFLNFMRSFSHQQMKSYPEPDCPIGGVTWYEAAAYCNWLSKEEGIPEDQWSYETNAGAGALSPNVIFKLKKNYLSLTGYRLPTEAEWEYACRAGAATSRYYGDSDELLEHYAWYFKNSNELSWPVGSKKPNDLGLFDMHGNVWNWCQERNKLYRQGDKSKVFEDAEDLLDIKPQESRILRGGGFNSREGALRSARRYWFPPRDRVNNTGFRVARTLQSE